MPNNTLIFKDRYYQEKIARIWIGKVIKKKADEYEQFLRDRAIPDYISIDGNMGGIILR